MTPTLSPERASQFARIALGHVGREFPNKLDHVLNGEDDAKGPRALHPIFFGSFDWHSAVHGHWLLARLYRRFPDLPEAGNIRSWLDRQFTDGNVAAELAYLARPSSGGFERPYGWAWALMLGGELMRHMTEEGRRWAEAYKPLADAFAARFRKFLPVATYPLRCCCRRITRVSRATARCRRCSRKRRWTGMRATAISGRWNRRRTNFCRRRWWKPLPCDSFCRRPISRTGWRTFSPGLPTANLQQCFRPRP
jgi:hypothetical protein